MSGMWWRAPRQRMKSKLRSGKGRVSTEAWVTRTFDRSRVTECAARTASLGSTASTKAQREATYCDQRPPPHPRSSAVALAGSIAAVTTSKYSSPIRWISESENRSNLVHSSPNETTVSRSMLASDRVLKRAFLPEESSIQPSGSLMYSIIKATPTPHDTGRSRSRGTISRAPPAGSGRRRVRPEPVAARPRGETCSPTTGRR